MTIATPKTIRTAIIATATAVAVGVAGYVSAPDVPELPPAVAPIPTGEGVLPGNADESKLPPKTSDGDGDGVVNTRDRCPWNAGVAIKHGCP